MKLLKLKETKNTVMLKFKKNKKWCFCRKYLYLPLHFASFACHVAWLNRQIFRASIEITQILCLCSLYYLIKFIFNYKCPAWLCVNFDLYCNITLEVTKTMIFIWIIIFCYYCSLLNWSCNNWNQSLVTRFRESKMQLKMKRIYATFIAFMAITMII